MIKSLLSAGILVAFLVSSAWLFRIDTVTCLQADQPCSADIAQEMAVFIDAPLFFTKVEEQLDTLDLPVKIVSVNKKLPGELVLQLEEQVVYQTEVTIEGQEYLTANAISNLHRQVVAINQQGFNIQKINAPNQQLVIFELDNNLNAIIEISSLENGVDRLLFFLQNQDVDEIDVTIKEIDLRFNLPVLRTEYTVF